MITKLTKKQEEQIPVYIEKWVNKAKEPMDKEKAIKAINKIYSSMGEEKPLIVVGDSPLNTALLCALFWSSTKNKKPIRSQLRSQLELPLDSQFYSQLRSELHSQLDSQLYSQLDSQLDSQLYSQLRSELHSQLKNINEDWYLSLWWLVWCGWYDYGKYIGVKFDEDKYNLFMDFNSDVHFIIPYEGIAFISEKPTEIHWKNKLLHNDDELAVKYSDNYGLYCLNGVRVSKELVETPAEELKPEIILKEENAEVRREIVRKIGIERVCQKLKTKTLSIQGDYELMLLDLGDGRQRPYLKMKNPSIGVYHIEGVYPDCKTVEEALNWRNQTKEKPEVLT